MRYLDKPPAAIKDVQTTTSTSSSNTAKPEEAADGDDGEERGLFEWDSDDSMSGNAAASSQPDAYSFKADNVFPTFAAGSVQPTASDAFQVDNDLKATFNR